MVLVVLAIVWAIFLIPHLRDARAQQRPGDSISAFRRQLAVMQRSFSDGRSSSRRPSVVRSAPAFPRRPLSPRPLRFAPSGRSPVAPEPPGGPSRSPRRTLAPGAWSGRARLRKRRRDILYALLAAVAGSLVLGLIPGLRVMLGLNIVLDLLCVAYVALLIRARNLAAEREMKVRYLPRAVPVPATVPAPALLLRRSAN